MKMKEESEKVGLKLNIQKMKIMASGSITSWEISSDLKWQHAKDATMQRQLLDSRRLC